MLFGKAAVEISPHAHSSFEIHVAVANPVAKTDRLYMRFSPFIKRNVLMPGTAPRIVRKPQVVPWDRESACEAFLEQVRRKVTCILKIDNFDRFSKAFHHDSFPIEEARARCGALRSNVGSHFTSTSWAALHCYPVAQPFAWERNRKVSCWL